ncbi:MAG: carboxypeptidase regulatory-like domain-containing protein [Alphaproteobacteria bacterium]|nr:MAG: carboxypeptidase regulatory-like domain-containing protein [Alphaproteobacteria bacterium]
MFIVRFAALAAALLLAACSPVTLKSSFNAADASFINQTGTGAITGQAFLRRNDGMVVYAAGSEVSLVPKTPYSDERFASIYGAGKLSYFGASFKNDTADYYNYTRKTIADGEGRFTFTDLAAGSYYLTTTVTWTVQYAQQGGALMERVTVTGGQTSNVIMSGQ